MNWKQQFSEADLPESDQTVFSNWLTSLFQDEGLAVLDDAGAQSGATAQPAGAANDWLYDLAKDEDWSPADAADPVLGANSLGQEASTPSQTSGFETVKLGALESGNLLAAAAANPGFEPAREAFIPDEIAPTPGPELARKDYIELEFESFGRGGTRGPNQPPQEEDPPVDPVDPVDPVFEYNIEILFNGDLWTDGLRQAFTDSANFIESYIYGDLPDITYLGVEYDDIVISAEIVDIDGAGGILGRAGPTLIRSDGYLPIKAIMEFDVADASNFDGLGLFDDIVFHEMMHSIGFGTLWSKQYLNMIAGRDNFKGEAAKLANDGLTPKVETDGGPGTAKSHWDESTYGNEIMTGYINIGGNVLSPMSMAALQDMGYDTIFNSATPDVLPDSSALFG